MKQLHYIVLDGTGKDTLTKRFAEDEVWTAA